jgi:hopanoid-associated phosphorylase
MILAVTGLRREARIVESPLIRTISGGGDGVSLKRQLDAALREPVKGIVSFGVAGALASALQPGDCVLASQIVDNGETFMCETSWLRDAARRMPDAQIGAIAGSATILSTAAQKSELYRKTGAIAADMESQLVARAARARGLPFLAIRTISDAADRALPPAALAALKPDGGLDAWAIARSLLTRPRQIPDLMRTGRESEKAFAALLRSRNLLGRLLAFPDLG